MVIDEQEIQRLFEDGDRAIMAADVDELSRIFADDYVQYDESGKAFSRDEVIRNLAGGAIRYLSMKSTGRGIRLFGDFAIVHGSEEDEVEQGGRRFWVSYVYTDVVIKRDGVWRILASQLAKPTL